jgi:hypothetical protein
VAFQAVAAKFVIMHILMATGAIGVVGPGETLKIFSIADFFLMTEPAIHGFVFAGKWKTCF